MRTHLNMINYNVSPPHLQEGLLAADVHELDVMKLI